MSAEPFSLPADLTIAAAAELRGSLLGRLSGDALVLDASAVTQADSAGLQVLLSLTRDGAPLPVRAPSAAWTAALARYGVPAARFPAVP